MLSCLERKQNCFEHDGMAEPEQFFDQYGLHENILEQRQSHHVWRSDSEDDHGQDQFRYCDIRSLDSVQALAGFVTENGGQVDILVNNAGGQFPQAAENYSANGWRSIIDLNLNGTWNVTQALGQQMLKGHGGVICNIIMTIGRGNPGIAHSGAARAGVAELTRSLSYEWGPKVRINCLGPGAIITPGMEATYDDDVLSDIGETPIPQPGTPEDVANGVVFLVSPAGRFITGETLMVDGGVSRYGSNQALKGSDFGYRTTPGPDWV